MWVSIKWISYLLRIVTKYIHPIQNTAYTQWAVHIKIHNTQQYKKSHAQHFKKQILQTKNIHETAKINTIVLVWTITGICLF